MLMSPETTGHSEFQLAEYPDLQPSEESDVRLFLESRSAELDLFCSQSPLDNLFLKEPFAMEKTVSACSDRSFAIPGSAFGLSPVISEQSQALSEKVPGVKLKSIMPAAGKGGRKRKELELGHQELIAEIEDRRRRNTESARRNRLRRKNELQSLKEENANLSKENAKLRQILISLGIEIPS